MNKKHVLASVLALSLIFTTALAGCASKPETDADKGNAGGTAKTGGTLVVARKADANNLDPQFITNIPSSNYIFGKVYEGLIKTDKNMEFQPSLATEWKAVDDLTWEFKLRTGVTFHDGAPFNAEAVKKTFERALDAKVNSPLAGKFSMVKQIKAVDEHTVQFILAYPYTPLLSILASNEGSILSPKAIAEQSDRLAKNPIGTGPFKFQSWTPGQEMVLVKYDGYWGEKPKVDKVQYKVVPEDTTRVAMIESGEAQIADQLPVTELNRVQSSSTLELARAEGLGVEYIGFNTKKKPFDDVRVRQAVAYAIERDSIIKGVFNNVGSRTLTALSPKMPGYNANLTDYDYNINKAKQLLAEAGYPNGLKTSIVTDDRKERVNVAEVLQSLLKGIGIDLEVKVVEFGAYLDITGKGEHSMFYGGWGNATGDADYNQYNVFHSSPHGSKGIYEYASGQAD